MRYVSVTEIKTRQRCRREHQYAYVFRRRPAEQAEPLEFGTLIHAGLEAWWDRGGDFDAAVDVARHADADPFLKAKAEVMLAGYHLKWSGAQWRYEVVEVEGAFRAKRTGRWGLQGRKDVTVRDTTTGRLVLVEHKTAGGDISLGSPYWTLLTIDPQLSIYIDASAERIDEVLYDVLAKPARLTPQKATPAKSLKLKKNGEPYKGQRLKDETPEQFRDRCLDTITLDHFVRHEMAITEHELEQARWEINVLAEEILEVGEFPPQPRNVEACRRGRWLCSYFRVCSGEMPIEEMPRKDKR